MANSVERYDAHRTTPQSKYKANIVRRDVVQRVSDQLLFRFFRLDGQTSVLTVRRYLVYSKVVSGFGQKRTFD